MGKTYKQHLTKHELQKRFWTILIGIAVISGASIFVHSNIVGTEIILANEGNPIIERKITVEIINPTPEQVIDEIKKQSAEFGINTEIALRIAKCESGYNYKAKNPNSTARGVYQYLIATWEATESAKQGKERNDYKANIREAMIDLANGEIDKWNASKKCWSK